LLLIDDFIDFRVQIPLLDLCSEYVTGVGNMLIITMSILFSLLRLLDGSSKYVPHSARHFRRSRIRWNSTCYFFHVRLSVQMFAQSALLTRGRFSWNSIFETFIKICL